MQRSATRFLLTVTACLLLLVAGGVLLLGAFRQTVAALPRLTEDQVRSQILTTIEREAPRSVYVTGSLDLMASVHSTSDLVLLPSMLDLSLGTTHTDLQIPGKAFYGFEVAQLHASNIRYHEDGTVEIELPQLMVLSVEPNMSALHMETKIGWARSGTTGSEREHEALRASTTALRQQAEAHLASSTEPAINTAKAIEKLLAPLFASLKLPAPKVVLRSQEVTLSLR